MCRVKSRIGKYQWYTGILRKMQNPNVPYTT